jgi:putative transposase
MTRQPKVGTIAEAPLALIPSEVLDQFVRKAPLTHEEREAVVRRFKRAVIARALGTELRRHLGTRAEAAMTEDSGGRRHHAPDKPARSVTHRLSIEVHRDPDGTLVPAMIGKHEPRFAGLDDKVVDLYARGLTVREIQAFFAEMYAVDVSADLVQAVTEAALSEVTTWQARPLEPVYPVVFFDTVRVKIRDGAMVRSTAVYFALAVSCDGTRDILGHWIGQEEGEKFWLDVFTEVKMRGCQDILIAVSDNIAGIREALGAVFPATALQTCIVRLIRHSLDFASWKERRGLAAALRPLYTAPNADAAGAALDQFQSGPWGRRFPTVVASWRRSWPHVIRLFAFPPEVRRVIYTIHALERVHARLRKIIKTHRQFQGNDAAAILIWLALRDVTVPGATAAAFWKTAMNQFAILYQDRFTRAQV